MGGLSNTYPRTWTRRPPQMPINDYAVWRELLARRGADWREYAYDVELHGGDTPTVSSDPGTARAWARAVAKRLDAAAHNAAGWTLIEVRRNAGHATLGQIMVYGRLWPLDYPDEPVAALLIACETIDPDVRAVARSIGVDVWTTTGS